jgi:hypothetical protein
MASQNRTTASNPNKKVVDIPTNAPTIGTATATGGSTATVAFTASAASSVGGPISYYTAVSNPGGVTATGTSSPITVSGLSSGTSYTFTVAASNYTGSSSFTSASNQITTDSYTFPSTNLFARYDASNTDSITLSGNQVTTWNDISGNSRHATQSTSSYRPTYGSTTINGSNTILFDGSNDFFTMANTTTLTGNMTIYFVGKNNYTSASSSNGSWMIGSVENGLSFGVRNSSGTYQIINEGTASFSMLGYNVSITEGSGGSGAVRQTNMCWSGNGSGTIRWNKAANGTFNRTGFNPSQPITIIGNYMSPAAANLYYNGEMAEILIYNTAHNLDTIQSIESTLASKWGA